jgi:signal transduction histidine kinase/phage shock protein PspC (stress-responsive transcriptional regulator)
VERGRALGGVAAGIGETLDVDPTLVRLVFGLLTFASGAGIAAYIGAWWLLPMDGEPPPSRARRIRGLVLLLVSGFLMLRGFGLSDSVVWPVGLGAVGLALFRWRGFGLLPPVAGIALLVAAVIALVDRNSGGGDVPLLAPGGVMVGLLVVVGPWLWRLAREREAERAERIRSEERAELASRVHDSVLQTLALIQREDDPRRVATLARRQERELRGWLYPDAGRIEGESLSCALEAAATEIEELHGVRVEVVRTGDRPLDDRLRALVLAAREAMGNAARHSGADEVSVFADATDGEVAIFVRDRGAGFDLAAVGPDRQGIAESIRGRMERMGGSATVTAAPGEGVEVELRLPV